MVFKNTNKFYALRDFMPLERCEKFCLSHISNKIMITWFVAFELSLNTKENKRFEPRIFLVSKTYYISIEL